MAVIFKRKNSAPREKIKERGQLKVGDGFLPESRKKEDESQAVLTKGDGAEKLNRRGDRVIYITNLSSPEFGCFPNRVGQNRSSKPLDREREGA
ncbi:hypothetical protein V6N12_057968 [Hibiscus sabdariffa]|uniref:Uncharacterized protein n=1 Tax=Hibiscus sabdariffa TaxID=183260 RepID=A0ABR2AET9_9ROSI